MSDNYAIQAEAARLLFLTYDQAPMEALPTVTADPDFLYLNFLSAPYRICRKTGHILRWQAGQWQSADSHGEVLTLCDYLCDANPHRRPTGIFVSMASLGNHVHENLSFSGSRLAHTIDQAPDAFGAACRALGGTEWTGGDLSFSLPLFDDLPIVLRFWYSDEEFPPKLDLLWDRSALDFLRYETTWFAAGQLYRRLEEMLF